MKTALIYTVLALTNLIGFAVGVAFLPAQVPVHFDWQGIVDGLGSPWVFLGLPALAAVISVGLWTVVATHAQKNKKPIEIALVCLGILLIYLGWLFFAASAGGAQLGEKVRFPFGVAIVFPVSLLLAICGNYLPLVKRNRVLGIRTFATLKSDFVWEKTNRLGGLLFFFGGLIGAVSSVVFSCIPSPDLDFVSGIVLLAVVLVILVWVCVYAHALYRREKAEERESPEERA